MKKIWGIWLLVLVLLSSCGNLTSQTGGAGKITFSNATGFNGILTDLTLASTSRPIGGLYGGNYDAQKGALRELILALPDQQEGAVYTITPDSADGVVYTENPVPPTTIKKWQSTSGSIKIVQSNASTISVELINVTLVPIPDTNNAGVGSVVINGMLSGKTK